MENNFFLTDDLLWDYADGFLSSEEKTRMDTYLRQHPEWQTKLEAILAEKRVFIALPLEKPKAGFADRVMAAWTAEQAHIRATAPAKGKDWKIYLISAVFGLFIVSTMVLAVTQATPIQLPIDNLNLKIPSYDWGALFGNSMLRYGLYFTLTLLTLKFVEKYLEQRQLLEKLKTQA